MCSAVVWGSEGGGGGVMFLHTRPSTSNITRGPGVEATTGI